MDRLTEKHYAKKGYYMKCSETCEKFNCDTCESIADIVDRLGEYKDAEERGELVRVVRCKDCVHWTPGKIINDNFVMPRCELNGIMKHNDFCSYGKSREEAALAEREDTDQ